MSSKRLKISVIGDGGWGTTLAILFQGKGYEVTLWGAFPGYVRELIAKRENYKFLKGIAIPAELNITDSLEIALKAAEVIVLAVPSRYMRTILTRIKNFITPDQFFVNVSKGIENETLMRMSEVIGDALNIENVAAVTGPSIAIEVALGIPATLVASSVNMELAVRAQEIMMTERLRVYTSSDMVGVELGGSLKNIIAIAAGMSDGMGFGANAKAALLTRGLAEIARLGVAMGAKRETFSGLSGMGDLVTTCISPHSRNRWFGEQLAKGQKVDEIEGGTEMAVEGVPTTRSAYHLAKKYNVEMPVTTEMYKVIYEKKEPRETVSDLMTRAPKPEIW